MLFYNKDWGRNERRYYMFLVAHRGFRGPGRENRMIDLMMP